MGDRAHMTLYIGGTITMEVAEKISEAIKDEYGTPSDHNYSASGAVVFMRAFEAKTPNDWPTFYFEEVNYADLSIVTDILTELSVDWMTYNEAGGDYPAGYESYSSRQVKTFSWTESDENSIPIKIIQDALQQKPQIASVIMAIEKHKDSMWQKLRPFKIEGGESK